LQRRELETDIGGAPECQKLKNGGLDHYGAEAFEQQQFGAAGVEGVKSGSAVRIG